MARRPLSADPSCHAPDPDGVRRVALLFGHRLAATAADRAAHRRNRYPVRRAARASERAHPPGRRLAARWLRETRRMTRSRRGSWLWLSAAAAVFLADIFLHLP